MCVHVAEQIDHISSLFHKLPGDHTECIHPALPPTLPRFTLSSHFLHFPPAMLDPLFFHSVLLPSPYPPFLSLSCCASLAVREFLLISSPLINSHLNQSLLFLFNLSPCISSSSSFFYSVKSIWCASFPNFYTASQPISPRLFFPPLPSPPGPPPVSALLSSLSFSLIMSVLSGHLFPPRTPTLSPSSSFPSSLFSVPVSFNGNWWEAAVVHLEL